VRGRGSYDSNFEKEKGERERKFFKKTKKDFLFFRDFGELYYVD